MHTTQSKQHSSLNKRQDRILVCIQKSEKAAISEILADFVHSGVDVTKITLKRDLKKMVDMQLLTTEGAGRSVVYTLSPQYSIQFPVNIEEYFATEFDERTIYEHFSFDAIAKLHHIFSEDEQTELAHLRQQYQKKLQTVPQEILQKEFERLTIELSWKSSRIEGNTYTLLETEQLILEQKEAEGHSHEEATMILNHKITLDYIRSHAEQYTLLSVSKIEDVHRLLTEQLNITRNIRSTAVRITGTNYIPLDNQFQIIEALTSVTQQVNQETNPFAKAMIAMVLLAYIQPFTDGNKRTSRLIGNAMLLAYDCPPLSYRSVDEGEYKKAVILFYEQHNISYFKKLFIEQCRYAVNNYFG